MSISPPETMVAANEIIDLSAQNSLVASLGLAQIVRSAAHAAECPVAALYKLMESGRYEVVASFGVEDSNFHAVIEHMLGQVAVFVDDAMLILNDTTTCLGLNGSLFQHLPQARHWHGFWQFSRYPAG